MRSGWRSRSKISFEVMPSSEPGMPGTCGVPPVAIRMWLAEYSAPVASRTRCGSSTVARAAQSCTPGADQPVAIGRLQPRDLRVLGGDERAPVEARPSTVQP